MISCSCKFQFLLLSALWILSACADNPPRLIVTARPANEKLRIEANGEVQAARSFSVEAPILNYEPLKLATILEEGTYVEKGQVIGRFESQSIATKYLTAKSELEICEADYAQQKSEFALEQISLLAKLKALQARMHGTRLQLAKLDFAPPAVQRIQRLTVRQDSIEIARLKRQKDFQADIHKQSQIALKLKIRQARNKRDQAYKYLQQLEIVAPVSGYLQYGYSWNGKIKPGAIIWPNTTVAEIPDLRRMQVRIQLSPVLAQQCRVGQFALIDIPAQGLKDLKGTVFKISRRAKGSRSHRSIKWVPVTIDIDSLSTEIVPGTTTRVNIFTDTLHNVFKLPLECLDDRDSLQIVYNLQGNKAVPMLINSIRKTTDFIYFSGPLMASRNFLLSKPEPDHIVWPDSLLYLRNRNTL